MTNPSNAQLALKRKYLESLTHFRSATEALRKYRSENYFKILDATGIKKERFDKELKRLEDAVAACQKASQEAYSAYDQGVRAVTTS